MVDGAQHRRTVERRLGRVQLATGYGDQISLGEAVGGIGRRGMGGVLGAVGALGAQAAHVWLVGVHCGYVGGGLGESRKGLMIVWKGESGHELSLGGRR